MGNNGANFDRALAQLAARQYGVVTTGQLEAVGMQRAGISKRAKAGRLHRIHRGVYAGGHCGLGNEGRWMAAVLACGDGAVLSHRSAAGLWAMLPPSRGLVHVTTGRAAGRKHRSLIAHRSPSLPPHETTVHRLIPVTTPARTLRDLPRSVPASLVRKATRQAEYLGLPLDDIITDGTRSELEARFLRLCRRHRLPAPEVNQRIGPYTVDFIWCDERLVVEVDGYAAHRGRQAFEDDRARELELHARGLRLRRFSGAQVERDAEAVAAAVRRELARWRPPGKQRRQTRS